MRVFRICRAERVEFDGEGARMAGGRWNAPGLPVVYTAGSESLAILELLVHVTEQQIPIHHVCIAAEFPDSVIEALPDAALPAAWRMNSEATARIGTRWLRAERSAVLRVPSVIVPREWNFLINPGHPEFAKVTVGKPLPIEFDPRLWK